jgi:hypothetical protein
MVKMTNRKIRLAINRVLKTGEYPVLNMKRRPKTYFSDDQKELIKQAYSESFLGVKLLRHHIKAIYNQNNRYTPQLCCGWDKPWPMQPQ